MAGKLSFSPIGECVRFKIDHPSSYHTNRNIITHIRSVKEATGSLGRQVDSSKTIRIVGIPQRPNTKYVGPRSNRRALSYSALKMMCLNTTEALI